MILAATLLFAFQGAVLKSDDVKVGEGVAAKPFDIVEVQYIGTFTDGKEFDSSVKRNQPFRFQLGVGQVIKGWDQGVTGMKVGGERNLVVPPELGYGEKGAGELIPPKSTLKFNVKLVRIVPGAKVEVLKEGKGDGLAVGDMLDCKLSIKLTNGTEIADPSQVSKIQISGRIFPGLNQALNGIKEGEKRKVFIGYDIAFGEKGIPPADDEQRKAGSIIPPKADLNVEIEAVKITHPKS